MYGASRLKDSGKPLIEDEIFFLPLNQSEPAAEFTHSVSFGINKGLTRPATIRTKNHTVFLWIKPLTRLRSSHRPHLPLRSKDELRLLSS